MKPNAAILVILCLFCGRCLCSSAQSEAEPQVFAPGVISGPQHDTAPAFTPDGSTVFFSRSNTDVSTILVSKRSGTSWSSPVIAAFSGEWDDMEPAMAPDGSYLIFVSDRPRRRGEKPGDGFYNGKSWPGKASALWRVDKTADGWSQPEILPPNINSGPSIYAPAVTQDGSLYFMKPDGPKGRFRLFRAQRAGDAFEEPKPLPFSTGDSTDVDPAVAPDESFVVFGSGREPAAPNLDLFITFRKGSEWTTPVHLGKVINQSQSNAEARLLPDHRTLYFSSLRVIPKSRPSSLKERRQSLADADSWNNSLYNIWFVSLEPFIQARAAEWKN